MASASSVAALASSFGDSEEDAAAAAAAAAGAGGGGGEGEWGGKGRGGKGKGGGGGGTKGERGRDDHYEEEEGLAVFAELAAKLPRPDEYWAIGIASAAAGMLCVCVSCV